MQLEAIQTVPIEAEQTVLIDLFVHPLTVSARFPLSAREPLELETFRQCIDDLRKKNLPCVIALLPEEHSQPILATNLICWLKEHRTHPSTRNTVERINLYVMDLLFTGNCFRYVGSSTAENLTPLFKTLADACDPLKPNHAENFFKAASYYDFDKIGPYQQQNAVIWLQYAILHGSVEAKVSLARAYEHGQGVEKKPDEAKKLLCEAADEGSIDAIAELMNTSPFDVDFIYQLITNCLRVEDRRRFGSKISEDVLAKLLVEVENNNEKAICCAAIVLLGRGRIQELINPIRNAANNGNPFCLNLLGTCYDYGKGVALSHEKAFECFLMAADQGEPTAQLNVASCYRWGAGTTKNLELARYFASKAAKQNQQGASATLELLERFLAGKK